MALHKLKYNGTEIDDILEDANSLAGIIVMWSGAINAIPVGWALCDGTQGTPDLRNRFIVGAGIDYAVGNTGGAKTVTLTTEQMPAHTHTVENAGAHTHTYSGMSWEYRAYDAGSADRVVGGSTNSDTSSAGDHTHTIGSVGGGSSHENRPPYYALAYIMKL